MENRAIARLLNETADLMEIAGEDSFRIRSYRNAAGVIEGYPEQLSAILKDPERKVTDIPGIGKGIASVLEEIEQRGSFERRDQMLEKYPPTALELLKIQGLGPKGIRTLWDNFRVSGIDDLERICREHKLRDLPRMGAKLEEKILRSLASYRQRAGRYLLSFAQGVADEFTDYLGKVEGVEKIMPAGSLRRGRETVGDLDLLVTGPGAAAALEAFSKHPKAEEVLGKGPNKASIRFGFEGIQVDLRALPAESYGAALQYFTGSKDHNVALRMRAQKMGLTLSEYSLSRIDGGERVAGETEEEIYQKLGLEWIPPELRENCGEIEAAAAGKLPKLIELGDIRGDLHMHTLESDGRASLQEMVEAAHAVGYEYVAITDHSKALAMANGLDEKRAVAFAHQVREMDQKGFGLRVFSGIECDIRRDGTMDLENDALGELDLVIGSVHSYMNLEPAEMTDRLMRALECPSLRVLGHPTGRILLHREPFPFESRAPQRVSRN
ncbi:MAG: PHP domain-containing protein [Bryobacteraceae bacterium]